MTERDLPAAAPEPEPTAGASPEFHARQPRGLTHLFLLGLFGLLNVVLVLGHTRLGAQLHLHGLGFTDTGSFVVWGLADIVLLWLAWDARRRTLAAWVQAWALRLGRAARSIGLPSTAAAALEPRPPLPRPALVRRCGWALLAAGLAILLRGAAPELRGGFLLLAAVVATPVLAELVSARRRLRARVLLRGLVLAISVLVAVEALNLGRHLLRAGNEGALFTVSAVTGFKNKPNYQDERIRIDEWGFRAPTVPVKSLREDDFVVLLLGGSTCFGWGLSDQESLGPLLEAALHRRGVERPVVLNAATAGWFSYNELSYYLFELPHVPAPVDQVVFFSGRNDLLYAATVDYGPDYRPGPGPLGQRREQAAVSRLDAVRQWSLTCRLLGALAGPLPRHTEPSAREFVLPEAWIPLLPDPWLENLRLAAGVAAYRQLPTLAALQPLLHYEREPTPAEKRYLELGPGDFWRAGEYWRGYPLLRARLAELPASPWFASVDLSGALTREACPEDAYVDECHYTGAANRILAVHLADAILRQQTASGGEQRPGR